jgi:hypothetical protein
MEITLKDVSEATLSHIKAQYDTNRPCNGPGRPMILKKRTSSTYSGSDIGAIEPAQETSKIIPTLDRLVLRFDSIDNCDYLPTVLVVTMVSCEDQTR